MTPSTKARSFTSNRKKRVAITAAALVVVTGGAAVAFWTVGGSGTATVATGDSSDIVVVQTSVLTPMFPGDTAQTLSGNFNNPTNDGPDFVGTVTVRINAVAKATGAAAGICDATDYALLNPAMAVNAEVPVGTGVGAWSGATIQFVDKATVNQDACKGATLTLGYTIT